MRPVCVICTEIFLINSQISACPCGHVFHEECLFRWIRSSQSTCPQCRAKLRESTIVKRLYLTEADNMMSTQCLMAPLSTASDSDDSNSAATNERIEQLVHKIQELKAELKEKDDNLALKSRLIEQKDKTIKEYDEYKTTHKKKLNENLMLIDYLKKELENYTKLKEQFNTREKNIIELENRVKEFKNIEMIYKDHEDQFAVEMRKHVVPNMTASHSQSVIRSLVSANVLLKEQCDKHSEEKKSLKKKLLQMEREQRERERLLQAKQKECAELKDRLVKVEQEYETRSKADDLIGAAIAFKTANTPSKVLTSTPKNLKLSTTVNQDDSDLQYLTEVDRFEESYLRKKSSTLLTTLIPNTPNISSNETRKGDEENVIPQSQQRKRKELSSPDESSSDLAEITSFQFKGKEVKTDRNDDEDVVVDLVKPITVNKPQSAVSTSRALFKMNSFSGSSSSNNKPFSNNKSSTSKLDESVQIIPLNHPSGFSYQYDGLGGRKKIFKADSSSTSSSSGVGDSNNKKTTSNRIFKFNKL